MGDTWDAEATDFAWPDQISPGPTTSLAENFGASFRANESVELMFSEPRNRELVLEERRERIEEITGKPYYEAIQLDPKAQQDIAATRSRQWVEGSSDAEEEAIARLREGLSASEAARITPKDDIESRAHEIALNRWAENEDIAARARGWGGTIGQFGGAMAAQMTDPLVAASMAVGPGASSRLIVAAAVNAAIGGAVTAAQQPVVQGYRKELGLPYGADIALQNIGMAALGGGGLTLGVGGLAKGIGLLGKANPITTASPRKLVELFDEKIKNPTPEQSAARNDLEATIEFHESNPFTPKVGQATTKAREAFKTLEQERKEAVKAQKSEPKPVDALLFLKRAGGVKDVSGELKALEAHKRYPGLVNNKTGMDPDKARELLVDAGYIDETPFEGGVAVTTSDDVYQIISEGIAGNKRFAKADEALAAKRQGQGAHIDEIDEIEATASFLEARIQEDNPGFNLRPEEYRRAAQMYKEGMDPDDIVERLAMEFERAAEHEHITRANQVGRALDEDGKPPLYAEDEGQLKPLIFNGEEFAYRADPSGAEFAREIEAWHGETRTRIENDGDFQVVAEDKFGNVIEDADGKLVTRPASEVLDDLEADDAFLREIEACR